MSRFGTLWRFAVALLGGALFLLGPALYNGYPLVYADDGTYVYSGFALAVPIDRPITYGLFLRLTSLGVSLWFVAIVQALLVSYLLFETARAFFAERRAWIVALVLTAFAAIFTSAGWVTGQAMPDAFTSVTILSAALLLFAPNLSDPGRVVLACALVLGCMAHLSHVLIAGFLALGVSVAYAVGRLRRRPALLSGRRLAAVWSLVLAGAIALPALHLVCRGGFASSRGSHVFLVGRLLDAGVLKKLLDEECGKTKYRLCDFKDSLPPDSGTLLWINTSPLYAGGGWIATGPEYRAIIRRVLLTPKYLFLFAGDSLKGTLRTLAFTDADDGLNAQAEKSYASVQITKYFPKDAAAFRRSRQNSTARSPNGDLDLSLVNWNTLLVLTGSWLLLVYAVTSTALLRFERSARGFLLAIVAGVFGNAAVTATLSTALERYQSRAIWLLPLTLLILIIKDPRAFKPSLAAFPHWTSFSTPPSGPDEEQPRAKVGNRMPMRSPESRG